MIIETITKCIRRILIGKQQEFVFTRQSNPTFQPLTAIDLYIHIPFCKNICPYCPYNRIKYDRNLADIYTQAMLKEIEQYHIKLGKIEISSIYIGGGTPTTVTDELGIILKSIREKFDITGDICIETGPGDLNEDIVKKLKGFGVGLISLGIQSFNNRYLKALGRNYDSAKARSAVNLILAANFKSVNVDLMFTLPGQNLKDIMEDIQEAVRLGVNQLTVYPLFTFPYSSIGQYLKIKRVKMPNLFKRREMYKEIHNYFINNGYRRISVWGFKSGDAPRYSSVTRDIYIGLGAGAGSRLPDVFYFNTFSVKEYIETALSGKLPIAFSMDISPKLGKYYWLYWRFYETRIDKKQLKDKLGKDIKIKWFFSAAKGLSLLKENREEFALTERGSFYIHLIQNYFVLNYINKVWSAAMKTPWPDRIKI
jgi:oxygen-independent coproporphyrinogen III oxidase